MADAVFQQSRHLQAFFEDELDFVILAADGRCGISELFEFELVLMHSDIRKIVDPFSVIGKKAVLRIEMPDEKQPQEYFGVISELKHVDWQEEGAIYRATLVPQFWFLTQRSNCRIFQNESVDQIVEKVLKDAGITDFEFRLQANYSKREYCVQYRESDFNFVSRLLEEEGIYYYFEHQGGCKIIFGDSEVFYSDLVVPKLHYSLAGKSETDFYEIDNWREHYRFIPGAVAQKDFNFKTPNTTSLLQRRQSKVQLANNAACEVYDYHGRYFDQDNGLHLTEIRMQELEKDYETALAASQFSFIRSGCKFTFGSHRVESRNFREFVITSVRIWAKSGNYRLQESGAVDRSDVDAFSFRNEFTCMPAERVFRPTRRAQKPVVLGPQTAIVTTENEEEVTVDEFGRVHVHFHWDRYNEFDQTSSCWIRVSQVHAGKNFGMMDIPRRNEEVIVSFIEGDPDRPIITGRVYNGANPTPFKLDEANNAANKTRRGNTTKTIDADKTSYNEMSMDDTPGAEQIRINGQYNMDTSVNNNETHSIGVDRTASVGNNEMMSVGLNQTSDVGVNRTATIGANDSKTIGANKTLNVSANDSTTVGASQTNSVGMMKNEMVGIMSNELVGAVKTLTAAIAMNTAVGVSSTEQVGVTKSINVGSDFKIEAGSKIEIVCGGSRITMESGGKVTIEGTEFLFAASGNVKVKGAIIDLN